MGKREQVVLLCLSSLCLLTVIVLWLFLKLLWAVLQCVIVVFPDHTHFYNSITYSTYYVFLHIVSAFNWSTE